MKLDARGDISVAEIAIYTPLLGLALFVCLRHGFKRSSGWIFLVALCFIRIVGGACDLVTYNSPSLGLFIAVAILDSVGISPLLLATIGILSRLVEISPSPFLSTRRLRLLQLLVIVGMILSIVGGTEATIGPAGLAITTPTKIGIVIYIAAFVLTCGVLAVIVGRLSAVPRGERRVLLVVGLALPFLAARLVFAALAVFLHNSTFSIVGGSVGVYVGMALVEEVVVVAGYVALGWTLEKVSTGSHKARSGGDVVNVEGGHGKENGV